MSKIIDRIKDFWNWNADMIIGGVVVVVTIVVAVTVPLIIDVNFGDNVASGVVYNASFNKWPSGRATFGIRATENTVITQENASTFCLPKGSKYTELIRKAAEDKSVKLVVEKKSGIYWHVIFGCSDNVIVRKK